MKNINLLFCGDFAPCRRWYDFEPNINVLGNALEYIKNSDLAFVNLETPATNIGKPILKDGPNLRTKPEWLKPLKEAGFNLVGLANNHIGDYGEEGVIDCINNCEKLNLLKGKGNWISTPPTDTQSAPSVSLSLASSPINRGASYEDDDDVINIVGAGKNLKEAQKIFYFDKNNIRVAIIAVCEHEYGIAEENKAGTAPLDTIENIRQIQEARKNADFVIFTIHGGNEYFPYPRPYLRKQCQFYIEQGCDAVICHHPHVPGAYEIHNGKPIFYSLGNFIFDNDKTPLDWDKGYMVKLELSKNTPFYGNQTDNTNHNNYKLTYELIPYIQSYEHGEIKLMTGLEKESFLNRIEEYRNNLVSKEKYEKVWTDFCESKINNYLILQYSPISFRGIGRIMSKKLTSKVLLKNTKRLSGRLNYIRCESHLEVFQYILSRELLNRKLTYEI